jgi:hypothetical protein
MNVFSLFASLTLDKSEYKKGLDEAEREGNAFADNTEKKITPQVIAGWTAIATVIVGVGKKINQIMLETMNYADSVGDLAAKYGVSTDAISEMQYIADQSSTSVEQLTTSMSMLYMRAKQDGDAFKQLGISVKDNNGNFKAMDELFWETVGALNDIQDDGTKSAYMLDLFGRSAMNVGEVLRKNTNEINAMRQEAHDLGIVMSEESINIASDWNDTFAVLKLQGQSALASLVAGAPDAEERLQNFFDNVLVMLDGYIPAFANFGIRLLMQGAIAMVRVAPSLVVEILDAVIDTIFNINWLQVGTDVGKAMMEGALNVIVSALNAVLGLFGVDIPKVNLGVGENLFNEESLGEEYEISENIRQDITVKVEASGDSAVSEETAEKTAEKLAPYIDKILGGK